jgi:hypothetical protein
LDDVPHHIFAAIKNGLVYLSFEELPDEEKPPKRIWTDPQKLNEFFKKVDENRKAQYGGGGRSDLGPIENPVENEAAKLLIVGDK